MTLNMMLYLGFLLGMLLVTREHDDRAHKSKGRRND